VNLLLDTHAFLWFPDNDPQLNATAKTLIETPVNRKFVSMATCWEIAIKVGLRKLDLGEPATTFLPSELAANHFDLLGIELRHATFVETMPLHHRDPFDRLLIAQSMIEGIAVINVDAAFDVYGVTRLW
jgi:PIN domain nuclease of toxin-antitoxin system